MATKIGHKIIHGATEQIEQWYGQENPDEWKRLLREEEIKGQIAQIIYDLRTTAKLSQTALAKRVGTSQSIISRVENADYDGSALEILMRVCLALDTPLTVSARGQGGPQEVSVAC